MFAALALGTALLAWLATRSLADPDSRFAVLDTPNERSLHVRPTPRTGGLGIDLAVLAGWTVSALFGGLDAKLLAIPVGGAVIAWVSFLDDRGGIAARWRFLVHLLGGIVVLIAGLGLERVTLPALTLEVGAAAGAVLTILFVVWMTNLYNFMDGMDGFAGGMSVFGFGFLGASMWTRGDPAGGVAALIVAAASSGFLAFNFPPAKIFLGDVGSAPLGFVAAALMLRADQRGGLPLWASVIVFSPFITDATVTLVRRLLNGEKIWQAHRSHFYQRLVQLGWGHRRTVLAEYLFMIVAGAASTASTCLGASAQWALIAASVVIYAAAMLAVTALEQRARAPE